MGTELNYGQSLLAGLAGSAALTGIHEVMRKNIPDSPRMDLLGMQSLSKLLKMVGAPVPGQARLFGWTFFGDLGSNAFYYSLVAKGNPDKTWMKGALLGLAAGVGAVVLPKPMHLNEKASAKTPFTALATIAIYLAGGLVAAAIASTMSRNRKDLKFKAAKI